MTISPIRAIAAAAEGGTLQPRALPPGLITTATGQVVGFSAGGISPLAQSAGYPDAAPARVLRRPRPRQGGRSSAGPRSTALIVRRAAENPRVDQDTLPRILGKCLEDHKLGTRPPKLLV